jgi:hypothetical protein
MFATKETSVITLFAWIIGLVTCISLINLSRDSGKLKFTNYLIPAGLCQLERLAGVCFFLQQGL